MLYPVLVAEENVKLLVNSVRNAVTDISKISKSRNCIVFLCRKDKKWDSSIKMFSLEAN